MTGLRKWGETAATAVLKRVGRGVGRVQERKPLPYDLLESDDAYLVVFDAPGVERSDIRVRFVEDEVKVRIDRFRDFHDGFEMRFPGRGLSLNGEAELPDDASVDAAEATATLADSGVLRVRIPKDERSHDVEVTDEEDVAELDEGAATEFDESNAAELDEGNAAEFGGETSVAGTDAAASTESLVDEGDATEEGTVAESDESTESGESTEPSAVGPDEPGGPSTELSTTESSPSDPDEDEPDADERHEPGDDRA